MPKLLHVNSSPLYGPSISRALTAAFVSQWKSSHPDGEIVELDLSSTSIAPINAAWVGAMFTPEEARTAEQKELLSLSDFLLGELEEADEYVIGVPMHNFGVPSTLKLWIDQISRLGKAFVYIDGVPKGLLVGKKATFIIATGGCIRRPNQNGFVQLRRTLSPVHLRIHWCSRCNLHHRRGHGSTQLRSGSRRVSRASPSGCADARTNLQRRALMKIASTISRYLLGLMFAVMGLDGLIHFIHRPTPSNPLEVQFFIASIGSHFALYFYAVQLIGGLLLLSGYFVPLGLTLLAAELYNILAFHLSFDPGDHPSRCHLLCGLGTDFPALSRKLQRRSHRETCDTGIRRFTKPPGPLTAVSSKGKIT